MNPSQGYQRTILVIAGVSGSGKSTVGKQLAARLGWRFADADDFHPAANIAKLSAGESLTDADRAPWLAAIGAWIDQRRAHCQPGVVTCSALKRSYRDQLRDGRAEVRIVFLHGDPAMIADRMADRGEHFMKPAMLEGQLAALESPEADEAVMNVSVDRNRGEVVDDIITRLAGDRSR